jgi:hypothetical protein
MNIFESNGRINASIDPMQIPESRRAQFVALVAAQIMTEQAEANTKIADDAVAQAVKEFDRANAALPRSTFLEEARASFVAYQRGR